ncbi:kinase-like domain-containing protein [Rhizoctonia solani]|nr:kinase-like domain-containing protein [Rhizoctonia solani]
MSFTSTPNWVPSWRGTTLSPFYCEDSTDSIPVRVLDAVRIQDEQQVMLKMIVPSKKYDEGTEELELLQHFLTPPLRDHPSNHIVPYIDSFPIPTVETGQFLVMPLLGSYNDIPFYNIAEIHNLLQQSFDGLVFMHDNEIAHRDIASLNIMMDAHPLYDEPFHPFYQTHSLDARRLLAPKYRRSEKAIQYYFIDLGYAKWFRNRNSPRLATGRNAREIAPEQRGGSPYNPFIADVYQLGKMIEQDLVLNFACLNFLAPLVHDMTQRSPDDRPKLKDARTRMNTAFLGVSGWSYRWPIIPPNTTFNKQWKYVVAGLVAEVGFWMRRLLRLFRKK